MISREEYPLPLWILLYQQNITHILQTILILTTMKTLIIISIFFLSFIQIDVNAQEVTTSGKFGQTLNVGVGVGGYSGYYSYVGHAMPVYHMDYEYTVAKNFTLAPFANLYTYTNGYYRFASCNHDIPQQYFTYHETVLPVGAKGTFYFDKLLRAGSRWDFYAAASVGLAIIHSKWSTGYDGDMGYFHSTNPLFLDAHIGTEYHMSKTLGITLDISSGVATIGLAIH